MIIFEYIPKIYSNDVKGPDQVSLSIGDGELVVVISPSGAGKSTFLRSISRLHDITGEDIRVNDVSITRTGKKQLRVIWRHIGMISRTSNLTKRNTTQKNVLSRWLGHYSTWKSILGIFFEEDYRPASGALGKVGPSDKLHSRSNELSGEQQQRISIARVLVQQADIIPTDKPMASLDPMTTRKTLEDPRQTDRNMKKTVVINIHPVGLVKEFAGRILGFQAGRVIPDGTLAELTSEELRRIHRKDIEGEKEGTVDEA